MNIQNLFGSSISNFQIIFEYIGRIGMAFMARKCILFVGNHQTMFIAFGQHS